MRTVCVFMYLIELIQLNGENTCRACVCLCLCLCNYQIEPAESGGDRAVQTVGAKSNYVHHGQQT